MVANSAVIIWGLKQLRKDTRVGVKQKMLIVNLAIADLLMGFYLLILGCKDSFYGQYFPLYSRTWRTSSFCRFAAVPAIFSSEASLFFLTLISLDRFLTFKNMVYWKCNSRFGRNIARRLTFPYDLDNLLSSRKVRVILIWIAASMFSIVPLFLDDHEFEFSEVRMYWITANKTFAI